MHAQLWLETRFCSCPVFACVKLVAPRPVLLSDNSCTQLAWLVSFLRMCRLSMQGAMTTFTKGLGPHLISRGIRVNAIAPGPVWTPLIQQSYPPEQVT